MSFAAPAKEKRINTTDDWYYDANSIIRVGDITQISIRKISINSLGAVVEFDCKKRRTLGLTSDPNRKSVPIEEDRTALRQFFELACGK